MTGDPTRNVTLRRAAALGVDLVAPGIPAAAAGVIAWLLLRPDQVEGIAGLGTALAVAVVTMTVALAVFITNDIVVAASRGRTVGERLCRFRLEVPGTGVVRLARLVARATLRFGVAVLVLSVFGLATQYVGEDVVGVLVGGVLSAGLLATICGLGSQGPPTVLERLCGVRMHDDSARNETTADRPDRAERP